MVTDILTFNVLHILLPLVNYKVLNIIGEGIIFEVEQIVQLHVGEDLQIHGGMFAFPTD